MMFELGVVISYGSACVSISPKRIFRSVPRQLNPRKEKLNARLFETGPDDFVGS